MNTTRRDSNGIERDAFGNINPAHIHKAVAIDVQNIIEHHRNYAQCIDDSFQKLATTQECFAALNNLQDYIYNTKKLLDILDEKDAFYNLINKKYMIAKELYTQYYLQFTLM